MAKKSKGGVLSTPMQRAPWQSISLHGNAKTDINVANGPTQAAMVNVKAKPGKISTAVGSVGDPRGSK